MARKKYALEHGEGSFYQRSGDGRWVGVLEAGWTDKGARRRVTVSSRDKDRAWDKLVAARKQIALTGDAPTKTVTLKAWVETWLVEIAQPRMRPQSLEQNRSRLKKWVIPAMGHRRLDRLTPGDVRNLHKALFDAGRKPGTVVGVHASLRSCLEDAVAEGYTVPPSVLAVKPPSAGESDRDAIPLEDALRLVRSIGDGPDSPRWIAALVQGMRQGECLGLTWDAINWEHGTIDVTAQLVQLRYADRKAGTFQIPSGYRAKHLIGAYHLAEPKSRSSRRIIPLVPWMKTALEAWREKAPPSPYGLVWPRIGGRFDGQGRPRQPSVDHAEWDALCDAAEVWKKPGQRGVDEKGEPVWVVEPVRYELHEARHTSASLLLAAGVDVELVRKIMGHSSVQMSRHYMHADTEQIRTALAASAAQLQLPGA